MKLKSVVFFLLYAVLFPSVAGAAGKEFYGIIEKRPKDNLGTWVIGGRTVEVIEKTRLEPDYGPLVVGTCVEVEQIGKLAVEIASETKDKCKK
jgi:hypothetical protein